MNKKQKKMLIRIITAFIIFIVCEVVDHIVVLPGVWDIVVKGVIFAVPYLIVGYDVLLKAIKNIVKGHVFDENFLMAVATVGAYGTGEYGEAAAVMLFYQVGEWFQKYAVNRSRNNITELMNIMPEYANIERDGKLVRTDPYEIAVGDIIIVQPGEKIPLDGVVIEGETFVDTAALTGESVPRKLACGDEALSGCINQSGVVRIKVTKEFDNSTVAKILELVENASTRKAEYEQFITRFAKYYTPIVCFAALAVAVIPSLFVGNFGMWFHRALTFLVVSCPCALVISIPLSFFSGIGGASKAGILVKG
ncbi:MAG: HAD-IC family P-type ATPase, partial [Coprococcus sp.]